MSDTQKPFGDGLAGGDPNFVNAVHSYYNNQPISRVVDDILNHSEFEDCKLVEIKIDGAKPVLALVTPYYAEKGTADAIKLTAVTQK